MRRARRAALIAAALGVAVGASRMAVQPGEGLAGADLPSRAVVAAELAPAPAGAVRTPDPRAAQLPRTAPSRLEGGQDRARPVLEPPHAEPFRTRQGGTAPASIRAAPAPARRVPPRRSVAASRASTEPAAFSISVVRRSGERFALRVVPRAAGGVIELRDAAGRPLGRWPVPAHPDARRRAFEILVEGPAPGEPVFVSQAIRDGVRTPWRPIALGGAEEEPYDVP